jgi:S-phase kinase-associated protein 1
MSYSGKTVKLGASDGAVFEVPMEVACLSVKIKEMLEEVGEAAEAFTIPLRNVNGALLSLVIVFCQYSVAYPGDTTEWDQQFCAERDNATLFELILAANSLDIPPLMDAACRAVACQIKGKTPEQIRRTFNIKNDFTPEEEAAVRKENEWCEPREC